MPDGRDTTTIRVLGSIDEVAAADWDACAGPTNPFVSHAFLHALEESGSVSAGTGWQPRHLILDDGSGGVAACAPLYLKSHSQGEYVFDWGWAEAYERAGGQYYPKLQCAVPFTPVPGPRLLLRPGATAEHTDALAVGMVQLATQLGLSSVHITFPTESEWTRLGKLGFLPRLGQQFHWINNGYRNFDDFLGALASRKRKTLRKERQAVIDAGITLSTLTGDAIGERHWEAFFQFYMDTGNRKWGQPYLTREFFSLLHAAMPDKIVLVWAEIAGKPVGAALNLRGTDTLYGRYWGTTVEAPFLHFEACYYRAIDFAIEHGLARVEAGAQGPHKIQRGYLPTRTFSAHWIADNGFRLAVANFLDSERAAMEREIMAFSEHSPYRQDTD